MMFPLVPKWVVPINPQEGGKHSGSQELCSGFGPFLDVIKHLRATGREDCLLVWHEKLPYGNFFLQNSQGYGTEELLKDEKSAKTSCLGCEQQYVQLRTVQPIKSYS